MKVVVDYYSQVVNVQVASRVIELLKSYDLTKLINLKKISKILESDDEYPADHQKGKF